MEKIRVAINGFGRIGRLTLRELLNMDNVEIIAINDLSDAKTMAHLFKYDSNQGRFKGVVEFGDEYLIINENRIKLFNKRDPQDLPWKDLKISMVVECTGAFRSQQSVGKHLLAGADKVILSAPASDDMKTVVIGVNEKTISTDDRMISNASCTTNCLAPVAKILDEEFGLIKGYINTIHAYTADQNLQDAPHSDLRRARAAASSIIPTSTGAAKAVELVLPHLKNKLDGVAMRVPVATGSTTDFTAILAKDVHVEDVNNAIQRAAETDMQGIVEFTRDPIVSVDIIGNRHSVIFDSLMTITNGNFIKVLCWYDNEAGYAARTAELVKIFAKYK